MPKITRKHAVWGVALAAGVAAVALLGSNHQAISQSVSGKLIAGFRISITTGNPDGCKPASGQDCIVSYVPPTGTYTKTAAVTGFSYTFGNNQTDMLFEPAGTLDAGTVTLGATPLDGSTECVFSTAAITSLTVSPNAGQTIHNAVTALSANTRVCYLYSLGNATWDRSN